MFLWFRNKSSDRAIALIFLVISSMQLVEFVIWTHLGPTPENKAASALIPILLYTQPLLIALIMWIFKARTGSIFLNAARHGEESQKLCSLCNLREKEDIEHFIGKCPILREQRIVHFGKSILVHSEVINALNGIEDENWNKLYNYICQAIEYRKYLINEFNV